MHLSILYVSKYFTHLSILQIPVLHASQYFTHLSILYFSFYAAQFLCLAIRILGIIISIIFTPKYFTNLLIVHISVYSMHFNKSQYFLHLSILKVQYFTNSA